MQERRIKIINNPPSLIKRKVNLSESGVSRKKIKRVSLFRLLFLIFMIMFIVFSLYAVTKESVKVVINASEKVSEKYDKNKEDKNINKIAEVKKVEVQTTAYTKEEVLEKIKEHMDLPDEEISFFVKVKNPEELRKTSDIYQDVKKDDYLIAYKSLAILYDAKNNVLVKTITLK